MVGPVDPPEPVEITLRDGVPATFTARGYTYTVRGIFVEHKTFQRWGAKSECELRRHRIATHRLGGQFGCEPLVGVDGGQEICDTYASCVVYAICVARGAVHGEDGGGV